MTDEERTLADVKQFIDEMLDAAQQEAVEELADFLRHTIRNAGVPVGTVAMALVGAEMQLAASK